MTVRIVSLTAHGSDEIAVSFELSDGTHTQSERLVITAADCADLRLRAGVSDEKTFEAVSYAAALRTATVRGLSILGYGRCSEKQLVQKLRRHGIDREIAEDAAEALRCAGYLDSFADALSEAEKALQKGWGEKRIAASLREKGYETEAIRQALLTLEDNGADYEENCARLIRKRVDTLPTEPAEKQKLDKARQKFSCGM